MNARGCIRVEKNNLMREREREREREKEREKKTQRRHPPHGKTLCTQHTHGRLILSLAAFAPRRTVYGFGFITGYCTVKYHRDGDCTVWTRYPPVLVLEGTAPPVNHYASSAVTCMYPGMCARMTRSSLCSLLLLRLRFIIPYGYSKVLPSGKIRAECTVLYAW